MGTRYYYNIRHGLTVDPVVRLNGVVIRQGTTTSQDGISGPVDHFLRPGANELEVEIRAGERGHGSAFFYAGILRIDDTVVAQLAWPADYPIPEPPIPMYPVIRSRSFTVPEDHPKPLLWDAQVEDVPLTGTEEMWAPIRALHEALARGTPEPIYELFATRGAEFYRFYGSREGTPSGLRERVNSMMAGPYDMLPLRSGEVTFHACAEGRGVQVLRRDGLPAIAGQCRTNPKIRYISNPVLVRHGGVFQIIA